MSSSSSSQGELTSDDLFKKYFSCETDIKSRINCAGKLLNDPASKKLNEKQQARFELDYRAYPQGIPEFVDSGFVCRIKRCPRFYHLTGYVDLSISHPYVDKDLSKIVNIHGGVTFQKRNVNNQGVEVYTIGFDCGHFDDWSPIVLNPCFEYRDVAFVKKELQRLCLQAYNPGHFALMNKLFYEKYENKEENLNIKTMEIISSMIQMKRSNIIVAAQCLTCQKVMFKDEIQVCARCKSAYYCSRECQQKNWSQHKLKCKSPPELPNETTNSVGVPLNIYNTM